MCINHLTIIAPTIIINNLKNDFTLQKLFPCPDIYQNEEYKEAWMLENWNCKTDINNIKIEIENENIIHIRFKSEENPPIECITNFIKKNNNENISATLDFIDLQERYYGDASWDNGELSYEATQGYEKIIDLPEDVRKIWCMQYMQYMQYIPDLNDKINYEEELE